MQDMPVCCVSRAILMTKADAFCSIRRVKCDEGRPACAKCTSTGRKCDGYESSSSSPLPASLIHRPLLPLERRLPRAESPLLLRVPDYERHAFDFFCRTTATACRLNTPRAHCTQLALQLSIEAPVFRAIAALGSAYRDLVQITHVAFACPSEQDNRAIGLYGKAVASLHQYLTQATPSNPAFAETVLLACLLFVSFEMVRHNSAAAIAHLRLGQRIAREFVSSSLGNGSRNSALDIALRPRSVKKITELASVFNQIEAEGIVSSWTHPDLSGEHQLQYHRDVVVVPLRFMSLEDARVHLEALSNASSAVRTEILQIARQSETPLGHHMVLNNAAAQRCIDHCRSRMIDLGLDGRILDGIRHLTHQHAAWLVSFNELSHLATGGSLSLPAILMEIQHFYSRYLLLTCRETRETQSDVFSIDYVHVLGLIEQYLASVSHDVESSPTSQPQPQPTSALEAVVLPTLFLICVKCRDSMLRNRAIRALSRTDRLEVFQRSRTLADFAARIMGLEQRRSGELLGISSLTESGWTASQVPEAARFLDVVISAAPTRPEEVQMFCGRFAHERNGDLELLAVTGAETILHRYPAAMPVMNQQPEEHGQGLAM